jgi:hypothetical protein
MSPREVSIELILDHIYNSDKESLAYYFVSKYSVHTNEEEDSDNEISTHEYTV